MLPKRTRKRPSRLTECDGDDAESVGGSPRLRKRKAPSPSAAVTARGSKKKKLGGRKGGRRAASGGRKAGGRTSKASADSGSEQLWTRALGPFMKAVEAEDVAFAEVLSQRLREASDQLEDTLEHLMPSAVAERRELDARGDAAGDDESVSLEIMRLAVEASRLERRCSDRLRRVALNMEGDMYLACVEQDVDREEESFGTFSRQVLGSEEALRTLLAARGSFLRSSLDEHAAFGAALRAGDRVEAVSEVGDWEHAVVQKAMAPAGEADGRDAAHRVLLRFPLWGAACDRWVNVGVGLIAPEGTHLPARRFEAPTVAGGPANPALSQGDPLPACDAFAAAAVKAEAPPAAPEAPADEASDAADSQGSGLPSEEEQSDAKDA